MIEAIALRWAQWMKDTVPEHPTSIAVIKFALQLLIGAALTLAFAIILSLFTGKTAETLLVLLSFGMLRAVSGGFHFKSALACVITTVLASNILAYSTFEYTTILILNGTSVLLALLFAPSRIERQTRIPKKYYPMLKVISLLIISTNFIIMSPILASTFSLQAITLLRIRR